MEYQLNHQVRLAGKEGWWNEMHRAQRERKKGRRGVVDLYRSC